MQLARWLVTFKNKKIYIIIYNKVTFFDLTQPANKNGNTNDGKIITHLTLWCIVLQTILSLIPI